MAARIDYRDPAVMRHRAAVQQRRRGTPTTHPYVIGRWTHRAELGQVVYYALQADPATSMVRVPFSLTPTADRWHRWRSRQAAHQWLEKRRELSHLQVLNLDSLDATGEL